MWREKTESNLLKVWLGYFGNRFQSPLQMNKNKR